VWNDYIGPEIQAELDLYRGCYGDVSGLPGRAITAEINLPHLVQCSNAARLIAALAARTEQSGRYAEGLAIRLELLRCGALIRAQSSQLIGNLVGRSFGFVATDRPGGSPYHQRPSGVSDDDWNARRLKSFEDYLRPIGHMEAAPEFERELRAGEDLHRITNKLRQVDFEESVWKSGFGWILGLLLLSLAGWVAVFSSLHTLTHGIVKRLPLGLVFAISIVLCWPVAWQLSGGMSTVAQVVWGFLGEESHGIDRKIVAFSYAIGDAIPLLGVIALYVAAAVRRTSLLQLLDDLVQRWSVPAIAGLLLAYGMLTPFTVRQEAAVRQTIDHVVKHEGRFLAEGLGETWPK
jgi:hypothetical protein